MTTATPTPPESQNDAGHLASLGYASEYKREMSFWGNFALGFTLALILAVPDFGAVISGKDVDPVTAVLSSTFGTVGFPIVSFASLGIYTGFMMVVIATLRARLKGWQPSGRFTLGRWGLPVTVAALAYQLAAAVNMAWPRTPEAAWYDNYLVLLSLAIKPHLTSDAPSADPIPQ